MRGIVHRVRNTLGQELFGLVGNSAFIFSCMSLSAFFAFITQIFLARWMGAAQFGLYVFANSLCILLADVAALGYPGTANRFIGRGLAVNDLQGMRGFLRRGRQIIIASSLLVAAVGIGVSWWNQTLISQAYVWPVIIACACVPVLALMRLHSAVANAFSWFALAHLPISVLRALLFLLAICVVWFLGGDLSGTKAILLQSLVLLVLAVGQWIIFTRGVNIALGAVQPAYETRVWVRTAIPLLLILLCTANFREVTVIIAAMFLIPEDVGVYTAALRIAILIAFGLGAVDAVTMPKAARLYAEGDKEALQGLVTRATRVKFVGSLFALLVLVVFGKQILGIFGDQFVVGYVALLILACTQVLIGVAGPVAELLSVTGHQDRCLVVFGSGLIVTVGLNALLVPLLGIEGVAVATLLVTCIWVIWLHALVVRLLGIRPSILFTGQ